MQPLPHLETSVALAYGARDERHPSGISFSSYFVRAPTRGRRRAELDADLLFPNGLRERFGDKAIERAMDPSTFRGSPEARPAVPVATREWLADAALQLGKAEGFEKMWALLGAISELEEVAQRLIGQRTPRAVVRQVLHGVGPRALAVEPFAALLVRVLKIAQTVYTAARHAGLPHEAAWEAVQDRLWAPHPTGRESSSGAEERGAYLPSLVQAASGHARRRLRRSAQTHRTREHTSALLARFASGPAAKLWPWVDPAGRLLPDATAQVSPETAGILFFVLLTRTASERRGRGGPAGGLSRPFADAGFASSEWLPDRSDELAIRLLTANGDSLPAGERFEALSLLVRATLGNAGLPVRQLQKLGVDVAEADATQLLATARERLPELLKWLEENGRDLLERT